MERENYLPIVNTSFHFFGGHIETVERGWRWPSEHHPAFELMYIIDGAQRTITETGDFVIKTGDIAIVPIEENHNSYNIGNGNMTYFSMHFNLDDPSIKYLLIRYFSNRVITSGDFLYSDLKAQVDEIVRMIKVDYELIDKLNLQSLVINMIGLLVNVAHYDENSVPNQEDLRSFMVFQRITGEIKEKLDYQTFHVSEPKNVRISDIITNNHISQSTALNIFKKFANTSIQGYLMQLKINIAKNLLLESSLSIQEIAYKLAYSAPSHFSREFKRYVGITPRQYINQNEE